MKILFIGDIIGRPGRRAVDRFLPELRKEYAIDFVVANVENASGGFGVNRKSFDQIMAAGVDCATSGNHIFDRKDVLDFIDKETRLIRPANYGDEAAGRSHGIYETAAGVKVGVINISGRLFMKSEISPFHEAKDLVERLSSETNVIIVDFHAEATSEKYGLGWHLDGRATAVIGTHTHVPTADARLLLEGTAYMTDVGMTGAYDSIIGIRTKIGLRRFLEEGSGGFDVAKQNIQLHAALIDADEVSGRARSIEHIVRNLPPGQ